MRVLLVYLGRKGGGAVYSLEIAKALNKKIDVLALISSQVENLNDWLSIGIPIVKMNTFESESILNVTLSTLNLKKFKQLKKKIERFDKIDVIYYPMIHIWTPIINSIFKNIPKAITIHDPKPHLGEGNFLLNLIQELSIKQAQRLIVLSKAFVDMIARKGIPLERIDVIPHGNFTYYTQGKRKNYNSIAKTILFFGRIREYKGLNILLKAFEIIKQKENNVRLLIVGDGDLAPYRGLIEKVKDVEIVNRWIKNDEVAQFFLNADIVVLPYVDASQSGVIPLAYSFGLPVIASRVGGIPEQVEDGITGFLVNPRDERDLANKCLMLLQNIQLLKEMSEKAYIKAQNEINWEHIASLLIESFNKMKNGV